MKIHCYCFLTCLTIHVLWRHVNFLSSICLALSLLCRHIVIVFPHLVQKTHWYDFPKRYTTIVFFPHFYIFSDFVYTILFHTYKFSQVFVTKTLFIVSCLLYFPSMLKTYWYSFRAGHSLTQSWLFPHVQPYIFCEVTMIAFLND